VIRRVSQGKVEFALDTVLGQHSLRVLELVTMEFGRIGWIDRADAPAMNDRRDARHDHL